MIARAFSSQKLDFVHLMKRGMLATRTVLEALAALICYGQPINLEMLVEHQGVMNCTTEEILTNLPPYFFNHTRVSGIKTG